VAAWRAIAQQRSDLAIEPFNGFRLIRKLRDSRDLRDTRIPVVRCLSDEVITARGAP
jgi:hypothetical protein